MSHSLTATMLLSENLTPHPQQHDLNENQYSGLGGGGLGLESLITNISSHFKMARPL